MGIHYFVYDCESEAEVEKEIRGGTYAQELTFITVEAFLKTKRATEEDKVIIFAEIGEIKRLIAQSFVFGYSVAIVAKKEQKNLRDTFEIPKAYDEAIKVALTGECREIDLLYCHDEVVLWSALIGEAPPHGMMVEKQLHGGRPSRFFALLHSFAKIFKLQKSIIHLRTFKEQEIHTAASGIVVIEHDNHTCASNLVKEFMNLSDGKMVALLVSPSSVIEYIAYLYKAIFGWTKRLPKAVGVVLSERLDIEATPPLEVKIDGEVYGQTPVRFEMHKKALKLCASKAFWEKELSRKSDDKEVVKLGSLPVAKSELEYTQKHIPFFPHADTQRYQELFAQLRDEARLSSTFVVLMILSTILATVGLFLNSSSVVIGAMLLAPLMQPIVSYAMGLLRFDMDLFWQGLRSVTIGILLVLGTSFLLAWLLPFQTVTSEIAGRLHPTLLDLIVAIVSGIAAAYAKNNQKIIGSLAGVSIAVALVPPISTAGIGLGWSEWAIFQNAFLLFLTNFAGIVFAAALTFMVLGFSPVKRAKNGLFLSTVTLLLISVPLYFSFALMVKDAKIKEKLEQKQFVLDDRNVSIENLLIAHTRKPDNLILRFDLVTQSSGEGKVRGDALKAMIKQRIAPYLNRKENLILEVSRRTRY
ncbi:MAG: TIGR00341 family protein [Sulfurospirillum sp.]|nr:MAG: TIGR00341 family protein [Sulfurospirillum sp.]